MSTFMLEVLTPDKSLYLGKSTSINAKAIDGELQVLPGHIPYVNILSSGELRVHTEDNTCLHFKHGGGILDVSSERVSVLVYPVKEE